MLNTGLVLTAFNKILKIHASLKVQPVMLVNMIWGPPVYLTTTPPKKMFCSLTKKLRDGKFRDFYYQVY